MAKQVRVFNITETPCSLGAYTITGGYSADGALKVEFAEPMQVKKVVGIAGDVVLSKTNDKSATATLSLMQGSDPDTYLWNLYNGFVVAPGGEENLFPFQIRDLNGTTLIRSTYAWVEEVPSMDFVGEATAREWKIGLAEIEVKQ